MCGNDVQFFDLGQGVDDLLRHAIAEVLVLSHRTHVGEREHGD